MPLRPRLSPTLRCHGPLEETRGVPSVSPGVAVHVPVSPPFQNACGTSWEEVKKVKKMILQTRRPEQRLEIVVVFCKAKERGTKRKKRKKKRKEKTLQISFFFSLNFFSLDDFQIQPAQLQSPKPIFLTDAGDPTARPGPLRPFAANKPVDSRPKSHSEPRPALGRPNSLRRPPVSAGELGRRA